jgi:asparagine synthase (glutamine-hydrolysing)
MTSCGGRYKVVFNGEIFNFKDVGRELREGGDQFNPHSDTAVLGPLYDRYGVDGLARLNGIFAFAIWDAKERELVIVRDTLGVKPVYFAQTASGFFFASELKALLAVPDLDRQIDELALADYLVHLWSSGERTPLRGVRKLLPGHYLRLKAGRSARHCWYRPPLAGQAPQLSIEDAKRRVRVEFERAVADQCLSDVPIGAFLSGGVDSSAIVAAMVDSGHTPQRTYCIGFDGPSMIDEGFGDDLLHARTVAKQLNVPLTELRVSQPEPEALEHLPILLDEPEADPAALYVANIARTASADGIKVLLGGTGGDDVFSGYRRHRAAVLRSRFGAVAGLMPPGLPSWLTQDRALRRRWERLAYMLSGSNDEFLMRAFEFNPRDEAIACLDAGIAAVAKAAQSGRLEAGLEATRGQALLDRMLYLELLGFLPDHNLNYTDKAAMAHGVEVRVPFLDTGLLELAAHIPWRLKTRGLKEKWILKEAFSDRLPANILNRKKTGFGAPVRSWFTHGRLRSWAEDIIASQAFRERGLYNTARVRRLLDDVTNSRGDGAYLLFAILIVEAWMRGFAIPPPGRRSGRDEISSAVGCAQAASCFTK